MFKKIIAMLLILCMCMVMLPGCGDDTDGQGDESAQGGKENLDPVAAADLQLLRTYEGLNLEDYMALPDWSGYEVGTPYPAEVTDEDVDAKIEEALIKGGDTEVITSGKAEQGDKLTLSFTGKLKDGTEVDGLSSENLFMTLGEEDMVPGFQEALVGKEIGKNHKIELTFPDPYSVKPELAGQTAVFDVNIVQKTVTTPATLDDDFVKENSDYKNVEEYVADVRKQLEDIAYEEALQTVKNALFTQISKHTEYKDIPADIVEEIRKTTDERYRAAADLWGLDWETFRTEVFGFTDDTQFNVELISYCKELVKQEIIILLLAEHYDIVITNEEFEQYKLDIIENSGYADEGAFEQYSARTIEQYIDENRLDTSLMMSKVIDAIYEDLAE